MKNIGFIYRAVILVIIGIAEIFGNSTSTSTPARAEEPGPNLSWVILGIIAVIVLIAAVVVGLFLGRRSWSARNNMTTLT